MVSNEFYISFASLQIKNQDACTKTMVHIPYNHKGLYFSIKSLAPKGLDAKDWHF
jgi:hypothetical protein